MKKLISLFLILCFAFSIFTACDKAESATDGTTDTAPTETQTDVSVLGRPQRDPTETPTPVPPTEPPAPEPVLTLDPDNMPEDFSFALRFNVMGCCYYDSAADRLCSGTHEDNPEEYTALFRMSEEERLKVYRMIAEMEISTYPDEYDPINDPDADIKVMVTPEERMELTVRAGGMEKTVRALTANQDVGYDDKAQEFLDVCRYIEDMLYDSEEWKALPDNKILFC